MKRLLLDQGLPRSTGALPTQAGWEVSHVSELGISISVRKSEMKSHGGFDLAHVFGAYHAYALACYALAGDGADLLRLNLGRLP